MLTMLVKPQYLVLIITLYEFTCSRALNVSFRLYTRSNTSYEEISPGNYGAYRYNTSKTYMFLTHGWVSDINVDWYKQSIRELLQKPEIIVIACGYKAAMASRVYVGPALNVPSVGQKVGNLIVSLHRDKKIPFSNFQIAGHSLGAHVAGFAGKTVMERTRSKIGRIFGLDPASPGFSTFLTNSSRRLDKSDAKNVVVLHTSTIGLQIELGNVDFYPNNGRDQKNCGKLHESDHVAATYYFWCSINNVCNNVGTKCNTYDNYQNGQCTGNPTAQMGFNAPRSASGKYFLSVDCL